MTGVADHSTQFLQLLDKHGIHLGDSIEIKETTAYDLSIAIAVNKKKDYSYFKFSIKKYHG